MIAPTLPAAPSSLAAHTYPGLLRSGTRLCIRRDPSGHRECWTVDADGRATRGMDALTAAGLIATPGVTLESMQGDVAIYSARPAARSYWTPE